MTDRTTRGQLCAVPGRSETLLRSYVILLGESLFRAGPALCVYYKR